MTKLIYSLLLPITLWGALAPDSYKELQERSGEHLFITALKVTEDSTVETNNGDYMTYNKDIVARVESITKSETSLKVGDTIEISFSPAGPDILGGVSSGVINEGEYLPAFLNHKEGITYTLGASNSSFDFIYPNGGMNETYGNNASLILNKVWSYSYDNYWDTLPRVKECSIIHKGNNILFMESDTITQRCYISNDTLWASPQQNYGEPVKGIISKLGSNISFEFANETVMGVDFWVEDPKKATAIITSKALMLSSFPEGKHNMTIFALNGRVLHSISGEYAQLQNMVRGLQLSKGVYILKTAHMAQQFRVLK